MPPKRSSSRYDPKIHGPERVVGPGFHARVYALVAAVPRGCVTTYGDVAGALGLRTAARQVGYALAALPPGGAGVPWHRVLNARGEASQRGRGDDECEQLRALRNDGVKIARDGRIQDFASRRHVFR